MKRAHLIIVVAFGTVGFFAGLYQQEIQTMTVASARSVVEKLYEPAPAPPLRVISTRSELGQVVDLEETRGVYVVVVSVAPGHRSPATDRICLADETLRIGDPAKVVTVTASHGGIEFLAHAERVYKW